MPEDEFEKQWLAKFGACIERHAGPGTRDIIFTLQETGIPWTIAAMERLREHVDESTAREIMIGCACQHPKGQLLEAKHAYAGGGLEAAHAVLQKQFEIFLREELKLGGRLINEIFSRNWGLAGVIVDGKVLVTKIPKSANLLPYLNEPDPEKRRLLYCHCPRVRDIIGTGQELDPVYCYCGAGFYKGIWEEITGQPVTVEVIKSVIKGDEVCSFLITFNDP